jgi:hypothetical protein
VKVKSAADIWAQRRGSADQIALLFIAMARAAEMQAYAMIVTDRDQNLFLKARLDWDQLNDVIAIVKVNGKELYFDPGERYCEFGKLHWRHTWTSGVRETEKGGAAIADTPFPAYTDTDTIRNADLQMDAEGTLHGTIRVVMTGSTALQWRQEVLLTDGEAARKKFAEGLQKELPPGVAVSAAEFRALTDPTQPLTTELTVSGRMGTRTGKRWFLPGSFFEAQASAPFASTARETPVYLDYSYTREDRVQLRIPANLAVEIQPRDASIPFAPYADYAAKYSSGDRGYHYERLERVAGFLYPVKDYPKLRDFYQKVSTQDQAQVVLENAASGTGSTAASGQK